jgi:hypothetical protein
MGRKASVASDRLDPLRPQFRARTFVDAGGKRRFGISLAMNGSKFVGSVLMRSDNGADAGGVAQLLESMAAFVRRG